MPAPAGSGRGAGARPLAELERWPEDAGPFGPHTWNPKRSEISWIAGHEREHAEMIERL
ncbi:MAG TPA: hypothetical protein VGT60_03885 [Candidatus Limnocylindria bacterium]|nr:hypothetical protein [Candidatus Limnocylindria bacterium]